MTDIEILKEGIKALDSKKADDIRILKVRDLTILANYFVIVSGSSSTQVKALADVVYDVSSLGECPASGSFKMDAMIIVPCSMKTAAGIASGYSDNLLLRAADVTLKEARQLVLVARESPLSPVHLRNLHELSSMGVRIVPPMISFYQKYTTIEAWTDNFVERLLEILGLHNTMQSWSGM